MVGRRGTPYFNRNAVAGVPVRKRDRSMPQEIGRTGPGTPDRSASSAAYGVGAVTTLTFANTRAASAQAHACTRSSTAPRTGR
jgi:hypothetical protein